MAATGAVQSSSICSESRLFDNRVEFHCRSHNRKNARLLPGNQHSLDCCRAAWILPNAA